MPGNGFAFPVRVGCEDQAVGILDRIGDILDPLGRGGIDLPRHCEIIVGQDRSILGGQVADMAKGGEDLVVLAEIFVDRLGLCGRLYNNNVHVIRFLGLHRNFFRRPHLRGKLSLARSAVPAGLAAVRRIQADGGYDGASRVSENATEAFA